MEIVVRFGRWTMTLFRIGIDDDDGPPMSNVSDNEIAPGFQPPAEYWEDEDV